MLLSVLCIQTFFPFRQKLSNQLKVYKRNVAERFFHFWNDDF